MTTEPTMTLKPPFYGIVLRYLIDISGGQHNQDALADMAQELTELAPYNLSVQPAPGDAPLVQNPCSICGGPITARDGTFVGTGDGSMRGGGSFAHKDCYYRLCAGQAEAALAQAREDLARALERIAVLERALRLIQHEAAFAIADSADGCGVGWKRIEREARAALADTGKAQS